MIGLPERYVGRRIGVDTLTALCRDLLVAVGASPQAAATTAEVLVTTDSWGVFSHGSRQMAPFLNNLLKGAIDGVAQPAVVDQGPSWAIVDANRALPPATACFAMDQAIAKARATGIAYVGVRHSNHFGGAGYYAVRAAEQGLIGLSMSNVDVCMTVPFARTAVMGTNPIAYAVPVAGEPPVFLDIATSVVAISKVLAAKAAGTPIPDNWLVDADGKPTSDAGSYPGTGSIVPMAGHKGYGIALLIEVLAGVLSGAAFLSGIQRWIDDDPLPADQGHAFIAVDIAAIIGVERFSARIKQAIAEIRNAPLAAGAERILVPGEREWAMRAQALADGILLPDYVIGNLFEACTRVQGTTPSAADVPAAGGSATGTDDFVARLANLFK